MFIDLAFETPALRGIFTFKFRSDNLAFKEGFKGSSYGRLPLNHKKGLLPFSGSLKKMSPEG